MHREQIIWSTLPLLAVVVSSVQAIQVNSLRDPIDLISSNITTSFPENRGMIITPLPFGHGLIVPVSPFPGAHKDQNEDLSTPAVQN